MILDKKICIYTLCYNELYLYDYAFEYWKLIADKVIIYDNKSTDGLPEYLEKYNQNNFIEIRHFEYSDNNKINDYELAWYKNNWWKEARGKYDYVIVCDFDEMFYTPNPEAFIKYLINNNITIVKCNGYNLINEYMDIHKYNPKSLLHNIIKYGAPSEKFSKCIFFDPNAIIDMNYDFGCHLCNPQGFIKYYDKNDAYLFHGKYISKEYFLNKNHSSGKKISDINIQKGFGIEYTYHDDLLLEDFYNNLNRAKFINDSLKIQKPNTNLDLSIYYTPIYPMISNNIVTVIPVYLPYLRDSEIVSLKQFLYYSEGKTDICLLAPLSMDLSEYFKYYKHFKVVKCSDDYFNSIYTYNYLCLQSGFYKIFDKYKYMLIYQLDAIVFKPFEWLEEFVKEYPYEYYGSPHFAPSLKTGNGGFSLRYIKSFIDVCDNPKFNKDYDVFEDILFSNSNLLNCAPIDIGCKFSCQYDVHEYFINKLNRDIPYGTHYYEWEDFYKNNILY